MPASKKEAKEFVKRWQKRLGATPAGSNNEQQDTQKFWVDLLINVLGIPSNTIDSFVDFERKIWIPLHGIILPVCGGTANRSEVALAEGLKERAGTPVTSRPQALSRRARSDSPVPFAQAPRTPASPSLSRAA